MDVSASQISGIDCFAHSRGVWPLLVLLLFGDHYDVFPSYVVSLCNTKPHSAARTSHPDYSHPVLDRSRCWMWSHECWLKPSELFGAHHGSDHVAASVTAGLASVDSAAKSKLCTEIDVSALFDMQWVALSKPCRNQLIRSVESGQQPMVLPASPQPSIRHGRAEDSVDSDSTPSLFEAVAAGRGSRHPAAHHVKQWYRAHPDFTAVWQFQPPRPIGAACAPGSVVSLDNLHVLCRGPQPASTSSSFSALRARVTDVSADWHIATTTTGDDCKWLFVQADSQRDAQEWAQAWQAIANNIREDQLTTLRRACAANQQQQQQTSQPIPAKKRLSVVSKQSKDSAMWKLI
jgi:hypothetical protein